MLLSRYRSLDFYDTEYYLSVAPGLRYYRQIDLLCTFRQATAASECFVKETIVRNCGPIPSPLSIPIKHYLTYDCVGHCLTATGLRYYR